MQTGVETPPVSHFPSCPSHSPLQASFLGLALWKAAGNAHLQVGAAAGEQLLAPSPGAQSPALGEGGDWGRRRASLGTHGHGFGDLAPAKRGPALPAPALPSQKRQATLRRPRTGSPALSLPHPGRDISQTRSPGKRRPARAEPRKAEARRFEAAIREADQPKGEEGPRWSREWWEVGHLPDRLCRLADII